MPGCNKLRVIFEDCLVKRTLPPQGCGKFTLSSTPGGNPSFRIIGASFRVNSAAGPKSTSFVRYVCDTAIGRDAVDRSFARGAHGAGVVDVLAHVRPAIDPGNHQVRLLLQQSVKRQNHRVGGSSLHRVFVFANLLAINRLAKRERLRRGTAFLEGAMTVTFAQSLNALTSARRPAAWIPSSLVIRIFGKRSDILLITFQSAEAGLVTPLLPANFRPRHLAWTTGEGHNRITNGRDDWI